MLPNYNELILIALQRKKY